MIDSDKRIVVRHALHSLQHLQQHSRMLQKPEVLNNEAHSK
jgi:hypothetical protein